MTPSLPTPDRPSAGAPAPAATDNWYPDNLRRITERLAALACQPLTVPPVAVFDFDNTCIFRDVGQAVFRYQLQQLHYRLLPEQLAAILPPPAGELAGRPMAAIVATLVASYRVLYPLLLSGRQLQALRLPEAKLFTTLLLWFTAQARRDDRLGPPYVLPFMGRLLAGYTTDELRALAVDVVDAAGREPLAEDSLAIEAPAPIGAISTSFPLGLHAFPEMRALMQRLAALGVERYVISASTEWLVEGAAAYLGFPVDAAHIYGIRLRLDSGDVLTIADPDNYPVTFRQGKAEIINRLIGTRPLLVAGDADTDFEMLTLPDVDLRLLINRQQSGLISSLYRQPDILLQGLDQSIGQFRPSRESI